MGIVAMLVFNGMSGFNKSQYLSNAQREFLTAIRSSQNRVLSGANSAPFEVVTISNQNSYQIGTSPTVALPAGITIVTSTPLPIYPSYICFANPNVTGYLNNQCGNCSAGTFFYCKDGTKGAETSFTSYTITFSNGTETKNVTVEGLGMTVNRMYAN
jgi:hypothetical protein